MMDPNGSFLRKVGLTVRIHLPPAESHTNHRFLARERGMSVPRRERSEAVSGTGQSSLSRVAQNALDLCNSDPISSGQDLPHPHRAVLRLSLKRSAGAFVLLDSECRTRRRAVRCG